MKIPVLITALALALPLGAEAKDHHHHNNGHHYGHGNHHGHYYHGGHYYSGYPGYLLPSLNFTYVSGQRVYRPAGRVYHSSNSMEASVQRALKHEGYYYGPIDGDIGPGSRSAIRNYQAENGLAITGQINSSLIRSLGL